VTETIDRLTAIIDADISGLKSGLNSAKGLLGTFALSAAAGFAIKSASDFDKNLRNIQATARLSNSQMATMNKELLDLGRNAVAGPQAVSAAMYDVVGGVQDSTKWLDILKQSIATSEAGQADLAETTRGLVFITNAYNMKAKEMAGVSDVLTRTVGVGVGTMSEFVNAMSPIAITAKTVGVEFKDLGKMAAFLTTKGNTASESATQLQSVMQALLKPNAKMEKQLKKLGFASGSAALKQLGFIGTLNLLKKSVGGSTDELAQMFGRVEGFKGVLSLTGNDFTKFSKDFEGGLKGATAAARDIQLQGFDAQLKLLLSSLQALAIQVGQVLLPPLLKLVKGLTEIINVVIKLNPNIIPLAAAFLGIGAAAGPLIGILRGVGTAMKLILSPAGLLLTAIIGITAVASNHFGGFDKMLQKASVAASQLAFIVGFFVTRTLNDAATAADKLLKIVGFTLFDGLNKASIAAGQLAFVVGFGVVSTLNQAANTVRTLIRLVEELVKKFNDLTNVSRKSLPGGKTFLETLLPGFQNPFVNEAPKTNPTQGLANTTKNMLNQAQNQKNNTNAAQGARGRGFASGGYTGNQPGAAGIVHGREFVVPERGALVMKGGGGNGYSGPSMLRVIFQADDFVKEIDLNIAAAIQGRA
jgi:TP901 family phage tail tape measure protein